jgi:EpsD family peptidyl-prolyl cis-trans isomerase
MKSYSISKRACLPGAALCLVLLWVSGCTSKDAPKPSTQVAAKVGSEEISLHQINAALQQSNSRGATPEQVQVLSRSTLEGLIDQQVAVDQAIESKLNRDPDVLAQIEAARKGVLANAYVKQFVSTLPKPDAQAAKTYYAEHPALFSERRIYTLQEIVVPRSPQVLEQLTGMAAANRPVEDAVAWLKAQQISVNPANVSRAAEQIPLDLLPRMHALKDGQDLVFSTATTVTLLRLVSARTEPVSEALALPRITQYLGTQHTVDAITAHIKQLRSKTSVVYQGEFAQPLAALSGASADQRTAPQLAAALPTAATATPLASAPAGPSAVSSALEKGVAGLK